MLVNRKEKCMKIEAGTKRLESEIEELSKSMANIQSKIDKSSISFQQVFKT